ncbi:Beige/BEACH domain [Fragilaria crotonensis]|nr:Beige/BEACH domain [Fragilaria crotonensis]
MWSAPLCGAVARVCDMIEEKDLLKRPSDGSPHSRDQILLEAALVDLLSYGREMTGWCQLTLPAPPEPNLQLAQGGSLEVPEETVFFDGAESLDMTDVGGGIVEGPSGVEDALDGGRQYFVPPQVPGASSKVMLPILQPAFRVAMASLGSIDPAMRILIPSAINEAKDTDSFQTMSLFLHLVEELKLTLVAAIVGLSFPSARDVALHGMTSLRHILSEQPIDGSDANAIMSELFASLVEEIRARYEGERRRREQALFDAYDDEGESGDDEAESSQEVERMILGGDLIPSADKATVLDGAEDFVMFHETYENMFNAKPGNAHLGWDQYKGFGSALEECSSLAKSHDGNSGAKATMLLELLSPYLDTWDASALQDAEDAEIVGLYDETTIFRETNNISTDSGRKVPLPRSETAADAMSTYIEMASIEKSRLSDFVNMFLPSHRYSCQAYSERYCWSRYFEIVTDGDACGMDALWERGIADGNRDIRSRLVSMPCNPQFKRYIPKYLDHGTDRDDEGNAAISASNVAELKDDEIDALGPLNASKWPGTDILSEAQLGIRTLVQTGNLEIIDITKREIAEEELPELLVQTSPEGVASELDDQDDDIFGDGSLGFPTRDEISSKDSDEAALVDALSEDVASLELQSGITATKVADKSQGTANHHIASSIYSHPPDNSASILSLLHSSAPQSIEKHFDNCLHVKAEGSRRCTVLLSQTHLIIEYDPECGGLFEGELMAVREEAERQRLIEEGGGPRSRSIVMV